MKLDNIYQEEKKSNFAKVSEIIITMASRPSGFIGLSILIFHVILAFISPYIAPYDFKAINPTLMLQAPSAEYWFGTDDLGRDVFTRTILGGRTALTITFFGSLIALLWGGLLGIFCGLVGGKTDDIVMRIVDAFLSIPWILAMLLIVSLLGTSTEVLIPALGFFYGKGIVRVASEYVQMAILKGVPYWKMVFKHVLPNALLPAINVVALTIAWLLGGVVVTEVVFNYPGLGRLVIESISNRDLPTVQALAIILASIYVSINLLADLMTLMLNPRLKTLQIRK